MIRVSNADYLARPLRLSPTEATAVIVALRALRNGGRRRDPRGRRPHAGQARGGGARGAADPGWTPATSRVGRRRAAGSRPGSSTARPTQRRQVRLTYYVPSRDEESERVVDPRGVVTRPRASPTSTPGATAPRRRGCSGSTGSTDAEVLDAPVETARGAAARPRRRAVPALRRHHPGRPCGSPPQAALGRRVLPGRGRPPARPTASSRSTCGSADAPLAAAAAAPARARTPQVVCSRRVHRSLSARPPGTTLGLYADGGVPW